MKHELQIKTLHTLLELHKGGRDQPMLGEIVKIPVRNYTDAAILAREMDTVFRDYPMVAGHASHVRKPGDTLHSDWGLFPFVVVRDRAGRLRAFRGEDRHGGRQELPVTEHHGLVWVHPTPGAELDLATYLGEMGEDMEHFGINDLVSFKKNVVIKQANWKLLLKTYLEGYHVPYLHRTTLEKAFHKGVIAHFEHGPHIRLSAARTNVREALEVDSESWQILKYASVYYSLFPNTFFIMHPDYVSINAFYPLAPDRTIWTHEMLYHPSNFEGEEGQIALGKRFDYTNDKVFDLEDFAVAEKVQVGLLCGGNEFHTLGLEEGLLAMFQRSVDEALG